MIHPPPPKLAVTMKLESTPFMVAPLPRHYKHLVNAFPRTKEDSKDKEKDISGVQDTLSNTSEEAEI